MAYDPDVRKAPYPDKDRGTISAIEVSFSIPVQLSREQDRRLYDLIEEIARSPWNTPEGGVHWLCGAGSKPIFSQADQKYLEKPVDPNAPLSGEPTFDSAILSFDTFAREK